MNLDLIEKHVHLTELPNGVEVMFGGQRCLTITETYDGSYSWKICPLFAKLTYGANVFEDVPYSFDSTESIEEAVAAGLTTLHDLGAFYGILDTPDDTFAEGGIENMTSESVEDLDEAVTHKELLAGAQKAYIDATRQGNGVMARKYGEDILKHKANIAKQMAAAKAKRLSEDESEERLVEREDREDDEGYARTKKSDDAYNRTLTQKKTKAPARKTPEQEKAEWDKWVKESLMDDCRKEALKHSDSIMEAHDLAQGLFDSFIEDLDEAALSGDAYWKAKEEAAKEAKAKEERASMGIKEPVKKGRGKPTNIDLEFVHAAAKKNVEAGKRPTAGMERNEKIHFVRHLAKHPDFTEKHVAAAGRPSGTTKAAKVEKEVEKKKEASAFSMWAGLGKK